MTALQADQAAYGDASFRSRVRYYMINAAINVSTEAASADLHSLRLQVSQNLLRTPDSYLTQFALGALTNGTLFAASSTAAILDSDLQFAVNSLFNSFIGV